jgi:cell division protein ZapA (FtsZ GTPase activity inhibitor)
MINARVEKFGRSGVRTSNSASSSQLLALAALDLADELKSSEAKLAEVERLTRAAIANAISRIDRGLSHEGKGGESV